MPDPKTIVDHIEYDRLGLIKGLYLHTEEDPPETDLTKVLDRLDRIERKLDLIFGNAVLINGVFKEIK